MSDVRKLKVEFESAKRALMQALFGSAWQANQQEVQALLDRMTCAFNALLIPTMDDYSHLPDHQQVFRSQEYIYVYAINKGDGWAESRWYVMFINGKPVPNPDDPPLVHDYTRRMVEAGWKVISAPRPLGKTRWSTPHQRAAYELYFSRDLPRGVTVSHIN